MTAADLTAYERQVMVRFHAALKRWRTATLTAQQAFPIYHRDCHAARAALNRLVSHGWLRRRGARGSARGERYALGPVALAPAGEGEAA